jgi:hypothetical protein
VVRTENQSGDSVTTHKNVVKTESIFNKFLREVMNESNIVDDDFFEDFTAQQIEQENQISAELAIDPNAMTLSRKVTLTLT